MALAAGLIVVLIGRLFNRLALDVGVSPRVQLQPIKADALFSNGKFPHVWAHGLVEFVTTHAQISVGITCPDEPGQDWRYLGGRFVCHRGTAPGRAGRRKGLFPVVTEQRVDRRDALKRCQIQQREMAVHPACCIDVVNVSEDGRLAKRGMADDQRLDA